MCPPFPLLFIWNSKSLLRIDHRVKFIAESVWISLVLVSTALSHICVHKVQMWLLTFCALI